MSTTLLLGGRVHSPVDPFATALLVTDETVAWVGQDGAADAHRDVADAVVQLDGALVTPAFVDAHVHLTSTGLTMTGLDLTGARSLAQALDALERHARSLRGGPVLGHGWDETTWPERRPPTRQELDRAAYGAAVYLSRIDVHSCVASSALLAAAPEAAEVPGYDADGWLRRDAHHVVRGVAHSALTGRQLDAARRAALGHAASLGIASVHENGGPDINGHEDFLAVLRLGASGSGPEVVGLWGELGGVERARELGAAGAAGDLFADGAIGSRTAFLRTVYADADTRGASYLDARQVHDHVVACTRGGLQAGFHVIGDAATDEVVAGFSAAADSVGAAAVRAARHRLEHLEMPDADAIARLGALGVVASVQPRFDTLWGGSEAMYAERLGAPRAATLNPWASMVEAGLVLAFGSDAPVTPMGPWEAVRSATAHHQPEQRLSARAAFTAHTRGGRRAVRQDDQGVLAPGTPASYAVWDAGDLVVQTPDRRVATWSTDPRSGVPGLPDLSPGHPLPTCVRTVVRGRTVHSLAGSLDHAVEGGPR
ncbi:MAG: amidohydrolase family protein [Actinomycetota bacterium]|nr:amidohydrolase family protein [Actinomycetota bacterium]